MNRILIVDDNPDQLKYLREIVEHTLPPDRTQIFEAASDEAALRIVGEHPDLSIAVVDLFLSSPPVRQEGLAVLKELAHRTPGCLRILVTGKMRSWEVANPDVVQQFVSIHNTNRDRRGQLEDALRHADRNRLIGT